MNRTVNYGLLIIGAAIVIVAGAAVAGARVNTTASYPRGLYWTVSKAPAKGDMVIFCPPLLGVFEEARARGYIGAGFCEGGFGYMIKKILAGPNDAVVVDAHGVSVNGNVIPNSKPHLMDKEGRSMPRYQADRYILGNSEVLLMSDHSQSSFDARYFGPLNKDQIRSVIRPIWTW